MAVSGHNTKETHQSVIEALLRLRLFCNNGLPQKDDRSLRFFRDPEEIMSLLQQGGESVCKYCSCDILSMSVPGSPDFVLHTRCRRLVCSECRAQHLHDLKLAQRSSKYSCPFCADDHCSESLGPTDVENSKNIDVGGVIYPSKLKVLLKDVQTNPLKEKRYEKQ